MARSDAAGRAGSHISQGAILLGVLPGWEKDEWELVLKEQDAACSVAIHERCCALAVCVNDPVLPNFTSLSPTPSGFGAG